MNRKKKNCWIWNILLLETIFTVDAHWIDSIKRNLDVQLVQIKYDKWTKIYKNEMKTQITKTVWKTKT